MKFLSSFLAAVFVCTNGTLGDVNVLYGALAYANLPLSMQSMARLIADDMTKNLSAFAANRIADILKDADELAQLGTQRTKTENMSLAEDWDRLLWGLLETLKLESNASCRDARIEPNLCEEVTTVGELYIRHAICDEVRDVDWRRRVCPDQPSNTRDSRDTHVPRPTYRFRVSPAVNDAPQNILPSTTISLLSTGDPENEVPNTNGGLKEFDESIFD